MSTFMKVCSIETCILESALFLITLFFISKSLCQISAADAFNLPEILHMLNVKGSIFSLNVYLFVTDNELNLRPDFLWFSIGLIYIGVIFSSE